MAADLRGRGCETWIASIVSDQQTMLERFGTGSARLFATADEAVAEFMAAGR